MRARRLTTRIARSLVVIISLVIRVVVRVAVCVIRLRLKAKDLTLVPCPEQDAVVRS